MSFLIFLIIIQIIVFYIAYICCEKYEFTITWLLYVAYLFISSMLFFGDYTFTLFITHCISAAIQVAIFYKVYNNVNNFVWFVIMNLGVLLVMGILLGLLGISFLENAFSII